MTLTPEDQNELKGYVVWWKFTGNNPAGWLRNLEEIAVAGRAPSPWPTLMTEVRRWYAEDRATWEAKHGVIPG